MFNYRKYFTFCVALAVVAQLTACSDNPEPAVSKAQLAQQPSGQTYYTPPVQSNYQPEYQQPVVIQQPAQQPVIVQQDSGMGDALAGAAIGAVAGAAITSAITNNNRSSDYGYNNNSYDNSYNGSRYNSYSKPQQIKKTVIINKTVIVKPQPVVNKPSSLSCVNKSNSLKSSYKSTRRVSTTTRRR